MDGIDERILPYAGIKDGFGILSTELVRPQRELLEEGEGRPELGSERSGAPIGDDRVPELLTECVRRDRAVGARSERALVQ